MLHKHFKRARRHWRTIAEDNVSLANPSCDSVIAKWARELARLIEEVERLRTELKLRNKKKRGVHAALAAERDDLDHILGKIKDVVDRLPADPSESVPAYSVMEQLSAILNEFEENQNDFDL